MTAVKFCYLPEELIVRVFEELTDINDLLNCSLTCRLFHATLRDTLILQYHIELAVAGVEDSGAASRLTTSEKIVELKARKEGWVNLRFRRRRLIPKTLTNIWELCGGVLAHGVSEVGTRGLKFIELPSAVRGTDGRTWEHRNMGVRIRDFAIDPAQDLAVLIGYPMDVAAPNGATHEYLMHLRAMSTGENHPQAADAVLSCIPDPIDRRCGFIVQVMDNYLAVLFHSVTRRTQDQLYIWDWNTGQLVSEVRPSPTNRVRIDSFSFLSPRHFVVARFQADTWALNPATLEIYDFLTPHPVGSTYPRLVRSFQLPQVAPGAVMASILTRSDPSPRRASQSSSTDAKPFRTASTSSLLAVSMDIFRRLDDFCTFVLFVHHSALLEGLEPGQYREEVIPWEEWGPEKSRMLPTLYNEPTWVCYVHGTRYVRLERLSEEAFGLGRSRLRMLDFNTLALKREGNTSLLSCDAAPESSCEIFPATKPTVIAADDTFAEDVVTSLPYRDVRSSETFPYNAVMIDEECMVALTRGAVRGMPFCLRRVRANLECALKDFDVNEGFEFLCF